MTKLHKAQQAHDKAQQTGKAEDYDKAAELYKQAGNMERARHCEATAERLRRAG